MREPPDPRQRPTDVGSDLTRRVACRVPQATGVSKLQARGPFSRMGSGSYRHSLSAAGACHAKDYWRAGSMRNWTKVKTLTGNVLIFVPEEPTRLYMF